MVFLLQLLLYEYCCKVAFEYEKEIPQEGITWIFLELVMAEGNFSSEFIYEFIGLFSILSTAYSEQ